MEAKLFILLVLVAGSFVACTEGTRKHVPSAPMGRKREVRLCFGFYLQSPVLRFRELSEQESSSSLNHAFSRWRIGLSEQEYSIN